MRTLLAHSQRIALAVLLMLSLCSSVALPARAQQRAPGVARLSAGVRAGVTSTNFYGDAVDLSEADVGFDGGMFLTYRFHPRFAIQPEVLFALEKVSGVKSDALESFGAFDYEMGFLDVPVLFNVYLPEYAGSQLYLSAGPYVGFRLYDTVSDVNNERGDGTAFDPKMQTMHYGVNVGFGVERYAGRHALTLDARYDLGLTDLLQDATYPSLRNRGFMISVGVGF